MSDDDETRRELMRRLFYLITVAAEDAVTLAIEGQSRDFSPDQAMEAALRLRGLGERTEIPACAIAELCR